MKDIRIAVGDFFGQTCIYNAYPAETAEMQFNEHHPKNSRLVTPEEIGITDDMSLEEQMERLLTLATNVSEVYRNGNRINVSVEWGDWKHDHRFADHLVEVAFGEQIKSKSEVMTEEHDGGDVYSADHIYEVEEDEYER